MKDENLLYRIMLAFRADQKSAEAYAKKIKVEENVSNPQILFIDHSKSWTTLLYVTDKKDVAEEGMKYYHKLGIEAFLQKTTKDIHERDLSLTETNKTKKRGTTKC